MQQDLADEVERGPQRIDATPSGIELTSDEAIGEIDHLPVSLASTACARLLSSNSEEVLFTRPALDDRQQRTFDERDERDKTNEPCSQSLTSAASGDELAPTCNGSEAYFAPPALQGYTRSQCTSENEDDLYPLTLQRTPAAAGANLAATAWRDDIYLAPPALQGFGREQHMADGGSGKDPRTTPPL
ncbi:hypothetical protein HKX48_009534 [Thoreauomyces humboldtii]|nr:hypothetical protein HKX48_009534 [Thoreauomyces humboldtii]